jgi:DNA-binding SARP family transcriptional activator
MPAPVQSVEESQSETKPNFLQRLIQALALSPTEEAPADAGGFFSMNGEFSISEESLLQPEAEPARPLPPLQLVTAGPVATPDLPAGPEEPAAEVLSAYLLGPFRLSIDATPLVNLPSNRGLAVLKYMLHHRSRFVARDVLMDAFWSDADPESARNSLNVALHSLRQALRSITSLPAIQFDNGNYCLNPNLQLWIDVEEFERHIKAGQLREGAGQINEAIREYEAAISLYQGDFLADDPYEEWTIATRNHLRLAYIDALDRLSQFYFCQEDYSASATLCQLILARDNCQEDAHCRLMRCYSRQGQRHLALRQYQVCVDALRTEMDVVPESTTSTLAERIRRQEAV